MKKVFWFTIVLFFCLQINAQENSDTVVVFKEVRVTYGLLERNVLTNPHDIQVLTKEEIEKLPIHSVNELLAYVGGADVRQRGAFGSQADISMDGGSFEQTLVLLNGIKLVNSQTAHNTLNIPIPLSAIERIEIIRGSAAKTYGINALTGAINIITKKSKTSFIEADLYAGSSFKNKEENDGKGIYGGGGIELTGQYGTEKQSHLFSFQKENYNGQRYNSAGDHLKLFYSGEYRFNDYNAIQALGGYSNNKFGANGFYAAPGDINSSEQVTTALASLSSRHQFGNFSIEPRVSNRYDEDDYRYIKDNPSIGRSMHYTNALMAEVKAGLFTKNAGRFELGWESRFETINSSNIGQHDRNNHGIYFEYKNVFWKKFYTNIGAYLNYNSNYGWQVYPGVDLSYKLHKNWKITANVGSGQRIPSFTDLYLNQLPGNIGNPNLHPENAWNYGGHIMFAPKNISAEVGYFYRNITDFIDWVRDSTHHPYSPMNYGNVKTHGIYARVSQSFMFKNHHHLSYFAKYNYLIPDYKVGDDIQSKYVLESLKHQLLIGLNYRYKNFAIQVSNRWMERELNAPYNVLDARISYKIKSFLIYADVTNILDAQYIEAGAVPMPTRWFKLGVKYRFVK